MKKNFILVVLFLLLMVPFGVKAEDVKEASADKLIAVINGRKYYKKNAGEAFVAYGYNGTYTGPFLVSKDENAVAYYSPDHESCADIASAGAFSFKGETYYYSKMQCWMEGDFENTDGLSLNKYTLDDAPAKLFALKLLHENTTSQLIATINGRNYYKETDGEAIMAYGYNDGFTGPILVSEDAKAVRYYSPDHEFCSKVEAVGKINYYGKTYYYSDDGCWMSGNHENTSNVSLKKYSDNTLLQDMALEVIKDNVKPPVTYYALMALYVIAALAVCFLAFWLGKKVGMKKAGNI